jgi:aromatic-L-amino-acid decarboxylase
VLPEYLRNKATETGAVIDYRDWQVPLGRRFRSLKLWFVIRHYGVEGLRTGIRRRSPGPGLRFLRRGRAISSGRHIRRHRTWSASGTPRVGAISSGGVLEHINASGQTDSTYTILAGTPSARRDRHTGERRVRQAWRIIREAAEGLERRHFVKTTCLTADPHPSYDHETLLDEARRFAEESQAWVGVDITFTIIRRNPGGLYCFLL